METDRTALVIQSVEQAFVEVEKLANTGKVITYILSVNLSGVTHHYIGSNSIHLAAKIRRHQWDLEYYDTEDNEPTDLIEDIEIRGEGDFKMLIIEHLTKVVK